jgi:hypothetical protein
MERPPVEQEKAKGAIFFDDKDRDIRTPLDKRLSTSRTESRKPKTHKIIERKRPRIDII